MVTTKVIFVIVFGMIVLIVITLLLLGFWGKIQEEYPLKDIFNRLNKAIEDLLKTFIPH